VGIAEKINTMPLYQQIILTIPKYTSEALVTLFKKHTKLIMKSGGTVRAIEHSGVRPLPEKTKRKFATRTGERYFWEARYVSSFFDASPQALVEVSRMLRNEEGVLRVHTLRRDTVEQRLQGKNWRNKYRHPSKPQLPL
jgi:ribosomal protein S6